MQDKHKEVEILKKQIAEMQAQLYDAYKRINELNDEVSQRRNSK